MEKIAIETTLGGHTSCPKRNDWVIENRERTKHNELLHLFILKVT
jgi:hypothetical protein